MSLPADGAAPRRGQERALVVAALQATALTAAIAVPAAALAAGAPGAVGAAVAVGLVLVLFGVSAALHALATPLEASAWLGLTLGGLVVRLLAYFLIVRALDGVDAVHGLSLGLTAVLGIVLGQLLEMRAIARWSGSRAAADRSAPLEGVHR